MANFEVIQIALSEPSKEIKNLLDMNKKIFGNYKLITGWIPEHKEFYNNIPEGTEWHWLRSDVIRFEYLARCENVLYLDWDVRVDWLPELNELTWAYDHDYWAIYNGKNTKMFKSILEEGINKSNGNIKRSWLLAGIKTRGGNKFPKGSMKHGNISC